MVSACRVDIKDTLPADTTNIFCSSVCHFKQSKESQVLRIQVNSNFGSEGLLDRDYFRSYKEKGLDKSILSAKEKQKIGLLYKKDHFYRT
jgi:hypothetical protein